MLANILQALVASQILLIVVVSGSPSSHRIHFPHPHPSVQSLGLQNAENKIVGGIDTSIESHPHQVSLLYFHQHLCGGSLVSTRWVISAAHCTQTARSSASVFKYSVRLGSTFRGHGGTIIAVSRIIDHPLYTPYDYDITLIELSRNVAVNNLIKPIELPPLGQNSPLPGTTATVTGWGDLYYWGPSAEVLQEVQVPIISRSTCQGLYSSADITERMICAGFTAGGYDACQGDSGGPLVVRDQLVGVVSWGILCAYPNFPGVYASIPSVREWIRNVTNI